MNIGGSFLARLRQMTAAKVNDDFEPGRLIPRPSVAKAYSVAQRQHNLNGDGTFVVSIDDLDD